jgi:hypothetical protein
MTDMFDSIRLLCLSELRMVPKAVENVFYALRCLSSDFTNDFTPTFFHLIA